jgi:AcrR family transcriptional regulator
MTSLGRAASPEPSSRSKRSAIVDAATREFATTGYQASKWSDIAATVGIGSTALYHYFVSKGHCLFWIMADTLRTSRDYFDQAQNLSDDPRVVIADAIGHVFAGDELRAVRNRVLNSEMHLLARAHTGPPREHAAYLEARAYAHDIVRDWTRYLERCMREGSIPEQDAHLLARALLGLSAYVFVWYRADATLPLATVRATVVMHALALVYPSETTAVA